MTDQNPSDALTKRPKIMRNALIGVGIAAVLAAGGYGAYAIAQPQTQPDPEPTLVAEPKDLANVIPTAAFTSGVSDLTVNFDGTGSVDTDGEIVDFAWDFGDGTTGEGPTVSHVYGGYGVYTVTLTVTDDRDDVHTVTGTVELIAPPPPPPPANSEPGYTYGNYPPGATMPNIPGTNQPDTSACASSTGTADANGNPVCA